MTFNKTIKRNIQKTSPSRYRVRLMNKGKAYESYHTKLKDAITWRNTLKLKLSK